LRLPCDCLLYTSFYNNAYIVNNKGGKIDKKFHTHFSPYPGNPTQQYIKLSLIHI